MGGFRCAVTRSGSNGIDMNTQTEGRSSKINGQFVCEFQPVEPGYTVYGTFEQCSHTGTLPITHIM